jgi:proline dehydrogenase
MLLIDAEESWIQPAVDDLTEQMMALYNRDRTLVFNTFQMYRWDRLEYMKNALQRAHKKGYYVGVKLVRGAYMEKENERAKSMGYPSPICESKVATDVNYNAGIDFCMEHLERLDFFAGTHNEASTHYVLQKMKTMNLPNNDPRIWFGQLYGMSDHISYNLSTKGYQVAKYLPFGPVKDVMPYLIRRAEENTSVAGQTNRELELIRTERKRRKIN